MTAYIFAAAIIGWVGAVFGAAILAIELRAPWSLLAGAMCIGFLVLGFGTLLKVMAEEESRGPCLHYETGTQYNPATRTVMPYRYCAERGEWTE